MAVAIPGNFCTAEVALISFGDLAPGTAGVPAKRAVLPQFIMVILTPTEAHAPWDFCAPFVVTGHACLGEMIADPPPVPPRDTSPLLLLWLGPGSAPDLGSPGPWLRVSAGREERPFSSVAPSPQMRQVTSWSTWGLGSLAVLERGVGKRRAFLILPLEAQVWDFGFILI